MKTLYELKQDLATLGQQIQKTKRYDYAKSNRSRDER